MEANYYPLIGLGLLIGLLLFFIFVIIYHWVQHRRNKLFALNIRAYHLDAGIPNHVRITLHAKDLSQAIDKVAKDLGFLKYQRGVIEYVAGEYFFKLEQL